MAETTTEQLSIQERLDAIVEQVQGLLKDIGDEGAESLEAATSRSWENVRKYNGAADALEGDAARAETLRKEKETLPVEHSRAILVDDEAAARRLKERYTEIEEELEAIEVRRPGLEETILKLGGANTARLPRHLRADGALLHQQTSVTKSLDPTLQRLAVLDTEVAVKIKNVFDKVKAKATQAGSLGSELSHAIFNDVRMSEQRRENAQRHVNTGRGRGR